jgi:putative hemolysin
MDLFTLPIDGRHLEIVIRVLLQVLLLTASAFFSGSETALFSLRPVDLQQLRSMRHPRADKIHELLDEPRRLIISILCGNELVNIASSANMASILISFFNETETTWINILIMVPLLLLVGEVTPKTVAVTYPVMIATDISSRLLPYWIAFIAPVRDVVRYVADRITTAIVGEPVKKDNILHADEFRTLVEEGAAHGVLRATERILIDNMLEASEAEVSDIMTAGPRMISLDANRPLPELFEEFKKIKHPRVPLYLDHPDHVIGFLHSEDLIRLIHSEKGLDNIKIRDILRPAHFIPPTKKLDEMVDYFQENNTRAALVIDEYGGVLGIVSIKDVAEFIFARISGTPTHHKQYQRGESGNIFSVPGDMSLNDFNDLTDFGIDDPVMNTIGGVALRAFNRLPKPEDDVTINGFTFTIEQMEGLRIKSLRVKRNLGENSLFPVTEEVVATLEATSEASPEEAHGEMDSTWVPADNNADTLNVVDSEPLQTRLRTDQEA